MQSEGGPAQARVETLILKLKSEFEHNPQADVFYETARGHYKPECAESISVPLLEGCSPKGFKRLVQSKP